MINSELEKKINALKIPGKVVNVSDNAFNTCFYIQFADNITLNKIRARRDDIGLFFGRPVDIETDAGKVVIKVNKEDRKSVLFCDFSQDLINGVDGQKIPIVIGQKEDGTRLYYDLVKMPHLLAGGATGSGKSVFMHNCILSVLYSRKSSIILIDVKQVEFSGYENIKYLASDICYNARAAADTLKTLCVVMDERYKKLKKSNSKNIEEFQTRGGKMQYITVFIDELADLILANKKIESYLVRLSQLGRAAGIHLIVATQRPDANILSGLIRANIPSRVCFAVQKSTDSRIILDQSGGEKLRGAGDGLFIPIGSKNAIRFQAPYISSAELENIINSAKR